MQPEDSSDAETNDERIITNPQEYLRWCQSIKKIKVMDEVNPLNPRIYLKDISLHKKGPLEDKLYSKNKMYYLNIRRGNTLCELYDEQQQPIDLFFCRRGMMKFYDMCPEYLQLGTRLTYQHQLYRNVIFQEVDEVLKVGGAVLHLYALFKENGEHCQIGYIAKLNMWLVASKNVTIILEKEEDLEVYQKERFYWAKLIARQFLKQLQQLTAEELKQLKLDLDGKTLIGEYCGYEKHQHITKYTSIEIIYYAVVENAGFTRCLPVEEAFQLFDRYRMKKVRTTTIKSISKQNDLYSNIYELMKKTAQGTMKEEGEGSVLYIVSERNSTHEQRVVSVSKLKTTEYFIFRKLREMLKIHLHKKGQTANTIEKFRFQMEQIVKGSFEPPKPLNYYSKVAEMAFKEVEQRMSEMQESELRYRFVAFIEEVERNAAEELEQKQLKLKQAVSSEKELGNGEFSKVVVVCLPKTFDIQTEKALKELDAKIEDSFRQPSEPKLEPAQSKSIAVVHMVPRLTAREKNLNTHFIVCKYALEEKAVILQRLSREKEPYNQSIISFIKSQDRQKSLELLLAKIASFVDLCKEKAVSYEVVEGVSDMQSIPHRAARKLFGKIKPQKIATAVGPYRYIILPFMLPGSGKSTLCDLSEKFPFKTQIVSSDKLRQQLYKQIQQNNPDTQYTFDQLFKLAGKEVRNRYFSELNKRLSEDVAFNEILYLDRIFVPGDLDSELEQLQSNPKHKIVVLTQESHTWRNNEHQYPFSVTFLLNCFRRSIERQNHESLNTDAIQTLRILTKFYQMFRGFKFATVEKKHPGVKVMKLQFVKEGKDDDRELPQLLKNKLKQCLRAINPGYDANESSAFGEFVQLYYDYHRELEVRNPERQHLLKQFNMAMEHFSRQ